MASWEKWVPQTFKDSADSMPTDELEQAILDANKEVKATEEARSQDTKLQVLKEDLRELNGGYSDTLKTLRAKINYGLSILQTRGTPSRH
jgi:hypothetical protein